MSYLTKFGARVLELRALQCGWLDGTGLPVTQAALKWLENVRMAIYNGWIKREVCVYPTPQGGIQLEYDDGSWAVSIEFDPDTELVHWAATEVRGGTRDSGGRLLNIFELAEFVNRELPQ